AGPDGMSTSRPCGSLNLCSFISTPFQILHGKWERLGRLTSIPFGRSLLGFNRLDKKNVQGRTERASDFIGNRHAATRQGKRRHVRAIGIRTELRREEPPSIAAIRKGQSRHPSPSRFWMVPSS